MGVMHGGALATVIDTSTTLAILKADAKKQKTVSIDLTTSFLNPAKINDSILIKAICTKIGKNVAFSTAEIYDEKGLKLLATGSHVKAVLSGTSFIENWIIKQKNVLLNLFIYIRLSINYTNNCWFYDKNIDWIFLSE